ncbi:MAG TPA: tetratricopeptide repeat protein [Steroidobacteraceae bacterium]|nr:tetratricopeptide repeat protein [Steroidobacteraceae bacterium]
MSADPRLSAAMPDAAQESQRLRRRAAELAGAGRLLEALASVEAALRLAPGDAANWCQQGSVLQQLGRHEEAAASHTEALRLRPAYVPALANRSNAWRDLRRFEEALADADAALALKPEFPEGLNNRGNLLRDLGRLPEALQALTAALALQPDFVLALTNRGKVLLELMRPGEALEDFGAALRLAPEFGEALFGAASARLRLGVELEQAVAQFEAAARCGIEREQVLAGQAAALAVMSRFDGAAQRLEELLQLAPGWPYALGGLIYFRLWVADWAGLPALRERVCRELGAGVRAAQPHPLLAITDCPQLQLACARATAAAEFPARARLGPLPPRASAQQRIRVAYLSPDFGEHPVAHLLAGVLERHDRARFDVIAVALKRTPEGAMRRRLRAAAREWLEVQECTDRDLAVLLRERRIDIAVDVAGYTEGMRLGALAHRAAPVQVGYLGFAGTTGAACMDYLIADAVAVPPGAEAHYSEQVVRLPGCCLPWDDGHARLPVPTRAAAGLPERGFVFCAFTSVHKLTPELFDIWMRLLHAVPRSILWLRSMRDSARANLLREADRRGIDPERLVVAPRLDGAAEHLARQALADLFLDTLPYNAHSTALDALWAGVPVLTCAGRGFASRLAASALTALDLPQLITHSLGEYERRALELALDETRLAQLREQLAQRRCGSPLFDTTRYTRQLEAAYLAMHARAVRGAPPAAFDLPPP